VVKAGPTPAFVPAHVSGADRARLTAFVRKEQRGDGRRRGCSVRDGAVRRRRRRRGACSAVSPAVEFSQGPRGVRRCID
jgi:hypothetical protein